MYVDKKWILRILWYMYVYTKKLTLITVFMIHVRWQKTLNSLLQGVPKCQIGDVLSVVDLSGYNMKSLPVDDNR